MSRFFWLSIQNSLFHGQRKGATAQRDGAQGPTRVQPAPPDEAPPSPSAGSIRAWVLPAPLVTNRTPLLSNAWVGSSSSIIEQLKKSRRLSAVSVLWPSPCPALSPAILISLSVSAKVASRARVFTPGGRELAAPAARSSAVAAGLMPTRGTLGRRTSHVGGRKSNRVPAGVRAAVAGRALGQRSGFSHDAEQGSVSPLRGVSGPGK